MAMADRRAEADLGGEPHRGGRHPRAGLQRGGVVAAHHVGVAHREADGRTSPEELLAAAHASCYAMAFSHALATAGNPPERLHVTAVVSLNPKEGGGVEVTDSALTVTGTVPGLDQAGFQAAAEAAEQGCPISNAIRNNVAITVKATLD